jgi:hypothetical protein
MQEPIKVGDECRVIGGALESMTGPNLGKRVFVRALRGEHSAYGRIWQCEASPGDSLVSEYGAVGTIADFAAAWLQKIPPINSTRMSEKTMTVE